jgi:MFS family permease
MNNAMESSPGITYRAGTLEYTKKGLVLLFFWLLWGDFCYNLTMSVLNLLPLKIKHLGASNLVLGLLASTIPSIMNLIVTPVVSFRSDRYRSRWGRRIPFLLVSLPMAFFLILIGLSDGIGGCLHKLINGWLGMSPNTVILLFLGIMVVFFQFFHMIFGSVYYYLFNDVVPEKYLARFMALFQIAGSAAILTYNTFLLRYAETYMNEIFWGIGILCFIALTLMCWKVKEGDYPPPQENIQKKRGVLAACHTYFKECFTHKFYWYFFIANTSYMVSFCIGAFSMLFYLSLGISLKQYGYIMGGTYAISILLLYPAGILSDRYHSVQVMMWAMLLSIPLSAPQLVFLFYDFSPHTTLLIVIGLSVLSLPPVIIIKAAQFPMYMKLLPKDRFGQFASADAMIRSFSTLLGGILVGLLMDFLKDLHHGGDFYYRYIWVWMLFFQGIAAFFTVLVYKQWKKLGGNDNYIAPN